MFLKTCQDENDTKNLLILCNLRLGELTLNYNCTSLSERSFFLEKLGIGALPDDWKTSDKVPVLPGYSSSTFTPFFSFDICEVPLVSKVMSDVKCLSEEVSSLRNDTDNPRLFLRFEPWYGWFCSINCVVELYYIATWPERTCVYVFVCTNRNGIHSSCHFADSLLSVLLLEVNYCLWTRRSGSLLNCLESLSVVYRWTN